jgi:hypothetical protein
MISSDLHGAEEPIRWLLGWQRQDRVVTSPCMEKKKDALIRTLWQRLTYGGSAPCRWYDGFDGQDATRAAGRFLEDVAACLDLVWHVWQLAGGPEGPTFCSLDDDYAQKGPTSLPYRGLTSPFLAHF